MACFCSLFHSLRLLISGPINHFKVVIVCSLLLSSILDVLLLYGKWYMFVDVCQVSPFAGIPFLVKRSPREWRKMG